MKKIRCCAIVAIAGLTILGSGRARAATLTYNDLTETPTLTVDNTGGGNYVVPVAAGEDAIAIGLAAVSADPTSAVTAIVFYDPGSVLGGTTGISDVVYFIVPPGSPNLTVEFVSSATDETSPLVVLPQATVIANVFETGAAQTFNVNSLPIIGSQLLQPLTIVVSSDIEPVTVPEPASVTMAAMSGLVGLGLFVYRRRKATVA